MTTMLLTNRLRDQLGNGDPTRVATATFAIFDALQTREDLLPGEHIGAVAAAFILMCQSSRLPPSDVFGLTRNLMADANGRRTEFKAAEEYFTNEVLK